MADLRKILDEATPGPWTLDHHGVDDCLADVWTEPGEDEERICENATAEDASLIALAPDLAAALIKAREGLEGIERTYYTEGKDAVWRSAHMRAISSATLAEIDALMGGEDD